MSGIAGIYHLNQQPVDPDELKQLLEVLAHRGPDRADCWWDGPVGMIHRHLWTTPESQHEYLPLVKGSRVLTADARLDNRDELTPLLSLPSRPLHTIADSEFILAAYERWGDDCPRHLLGDFAFAIWDGSQRRWFCARDHLGVKPFYYHHQPGRGFAFASEIKGLHSLDWVPRRLNPTRLGDFLTLMLEDKAITSFEELWRLPPASRLWVDATGLRIDTYWTLDPDYELQLESDQAYATTFCQLFTAAVRCRLRSAFPVGSQLSGGLDSSAVTSVAEQIWQDTGGEKLHTFSNIFDTLVICDERPYIQTVLQQGAYHPHTVHADQFGPLTDLEQIWQYEDEPLLGPSHGYPWRLNQAAQRAGVRVVLDGFDGDTVVGHGLDRLGELAAQQQWPEFTEALATASQHYDVTIAALLTHYGFPPLRQWAQQGRWLAWLRAVRFIHRHFGYPRHRLYWKQGIKPALTSLVRRLRRPVTLALGPAGQSASAEDVIAPQFAAAIGLQQRLETFAVHQPSMRSVRRSHYQDLTGGVLPLNLELIDRYGAAFQLEIRHPFLDRRLVEFCLAVPAEQTFSRGWGRLIMRRGLQGILPEPIQWRGDKTSMTPNFIHGLANLDRPIVEQALQDYGPELAAYVQVDRWQQAWQQVQAAGEQPSSDPAIARAALVVWRSTILALWLNRWQERS